MTIEGAHRLAAIAAAAAAFAALCAGAAGVARAATFARVPDATACAEAAAFAPDDDSEDAERARRRCRMDEFSRRVATQRQEKWRAGEQRREERVAAVRAASQPPRAERPFGLDLFVGGGLASWGVAVAASPRDDLELEAWLGDRDGAEAYVGDSSTYANGEAAGVRAKWIIGGSAAAMYLSGGVAGTRADLSSYRFLGDGGNDMRVGHGWAHLLQGGVGLSVIASFGLRLSLEYVLSYVVYAQAALDVEGQPHDDQLRRGWTEVLAHELSSIRFQVGYGF